MLHRFITLLIYVLSAPYASAGAWVQPVGNGLFITQATYYGTSEYFDSNGELQPQSRFTKYELQPYVEYGLLDSVTIGGSAYTQHVSQSGRNHIGIADPELFARIRLWQNETSVLSIQPLLKLGSSYDKTDNPRGGSTTTDAELSLLYGRTMTILTPRDYVDIRAGYRLRNHGLSNQLRVDAAAGIKLTETLEVAPALRAIMATDMADAATYSENGDLDYSVLKAELTGIYHMNGQQWLQASFFKHVAGIQTGDGYGASVGFAQRF